MELAQLTVYLFRATDGWLPGDVEVVTCSIEAEVRAIKTLVTKADVEGKFQLQSNPRAFWSALKRAVMRGLQLMPECSVEISEEVLKEFRDAHYKKSRVGKRTSGQATRKVSDRQTHTTSD